MSQTLPAAAIAISLGDPAGIGPELICEAWTSSEQQGFGPFFVVYGANALREAAQTRGLNCPIIEINTPDEAGDAFNRGLPVLKGAEGHFTPGAPDSQSAELAHKSLKKATELAISGAACALVTAPISKSHLAPQ